METLKTWAAGLLPALGVILIILSDGVLWDAAAEALKRMGWP
jgi:hypothetical protein